MKYHVIFIRGNSDVRFSVVSAIMEILNPAHGPFRGISYTLEQYVDDPLHPGAVKYAATAMKRSIAQLVSNNPDHINWIVVDTPNLDPRDWQTIMKIISDLDVDAEAIGVGLGDENIFSSVKASQNNKYFENLAVFISDMSKYIYVESDETTIQVSNLIRAEMVEEDKVHD